MLDDTTRQRQTKCSEAVAKVWSSTAGGVRLGMQVVLPIWTDGQRKIPVSIRLWQKGGKSKAELAQEMLREAAERGRGRPSTPSNAHYSNRRSRTNSRSCGTF